MCSNIRYQFVNCVLTSDIKKQKYSSNCGSTMETLTSRATYSAKNPSTVMHCDMDRFIANTFQHAIDLCCKLEPLQRTCVLYRKKLFAIWKAPDSISTHRLSPIKLLAGWLVSFVHICHLTCALELRHIGNGSASLSRHLHIFVATQVHRGNHRRTSDGRNSQLLSKHERACQSDCLPQGLQVITLGRD
jgi:hypothetical protein